ncbi:hypothetical protein SASPL_124476 [Salvia splendens]|uniref:Cardiolipin synthase N-terminal domain-containing protein n=1 Tax=Salvia splendens TaxID=180675 RepID=A0A8X8XRU3_SALSN|nr:hypothetical protein SASPL_124476 [Salvia splendens]
MLSSTFSYRDGLICLSIIGLEKQDSNLAIRCPVMLRGAYALIPYFVLWRPPGLRRWPLNSLESKLTAGERILFPEKVPLAAGMVKTAHAVSSGGDAWKEFYQYLRGSKFIHATSIDFTLLSTFAPIWIYNDMTARKWDGKGSWLLALSLVPFLGPSIYLLLRPQLSVAREATSDEALCSRWKKKYTW